MIFPPRYSLRSRASGNDAKAITSSFFQIQRQMDEERYDIPSSSHIFDRPLSHTDEPASSMFPTIAPSTLPPTSPPPAPYSKIDLIVTCILIVLIVLLSINLAILMYAPVRRYFTRRYQSLDHVHQKRKERRYRTIDLWLVTKVSME